MTDKNQKPVIDLRSADRHDLQVLAATLAQVSAALSARGFVVRFKKKAAPRAASAAR